MCRHISSEKSIIIKNEEVLENATNEYVCEEQATETDSVLTCFIVVNVLLIIFTIIHVLLTKKN